MWKWLFGCSIIIALLTYLLFAGEKPPAQLISKAREDISKAEKHGSDEYAAVPFMEAKAAYDSAMHHWKLQNSRLFFRRDFSQVRSYALQASRLALFSINDAQQRSSSLQEQVESMVSEINSYFLLYDRMYGKLPLPAEYSGELAKAKLHFHEGHLAFKAGDLKDAGQKLSEVKESLDRVDSYARAVLEEYLQDHSAWQLRVRQSVAESQRMNTSCIIIDKYARTCMLYENGQPKETFTVELGPNWLGDKQHQGDKSTPEGSYKIVKMKAAGETRYYKALLLNYPNEDDQRRFVRKQGNGSIRKDIPIGGLIEIHGHGGKGTDWTEGCIALSDEDIDRLFPYCGIGTTVTIVGSLMSFEELYKYNSLQIQK